MVSLPFLWVLQSSHCQRASLLTSLQEDLNRRPDSPLSCRGYFSDGRRWGTSQILCLLWQILLFQQANTWFWFWIWMKCFSLCWKKARPKKSREPSRASSFLLFDCILSSTLKLYWTVCVHCYLCVGVLWLFTETPQMISSPDNGIPNPSNNTPPGCPNNIPHFLTDENGFFWQNHIFVQIFQISITFQLKGKRKILICTFSRQKLHTTWILMLFDKHTTHFGVKQLPPPNLQFFCQMALPPKILLGWPTKQYSGGILWNLESWVWTSLPHPRYLDFGCLVQHSAIAFF